MSRIITITIPEMLWWSNGWCTGVVFKSSWVQPPPVTIKLKLKKHGKSVTIMTFSFLKMTVKASLKMLST
jgi:hypothetical protein